jgi:hypothetical protein
LHFPQLAIHDRGVVKLNVACRLHDRSSLFLKDTVDWPLKDNHWVSELNLNALKVKTERTFPISGGYRG